MMRDIVFVNLHHSDDRLLSVRQRSLATNTQHFLVMYATIRPSISILSLNTYQLKKEDLRRNQTIQRQRIHNCIRIHHEQILVERWVYTDDILDLVINLKLQRIHGGIEVDLKQVVSKEIIEPKKK